MAAAPLVSIIDDDDSLRIALVSLARSAGYEACGFASAEEFLQSTVVETVSCVVTDIQMAGMSGIDLKLHLTARQIDLPVIMITARSEHALEDKARNAGAVCYLRKPFDGGALIDCLEKVLGRQF